jgi:phosphonate transport system permease protein
MSALTPEQKIAKKQARRAAFHASKFYRVVSAPFVHFSAWYKKISVRNIQVDLSEAQDGSMIRTVPKKRPIGLYAALIAFVVILILCFLPLNFRNVNWKWAYFWNDEICRLFIPSALRTKTIAGWWSYMWTSFTSSFSHLFYVCFLGTVLGSLLAIPVYYLCAQNVTRNALIRTPVRLFNDLLRTIPMFIVGYIISLIFSTGSTISAVLTIAVFSLGIMYQMMFEYIETLEMSPFEAIRSCGGNNLQCTNIGLHPEVKPMFFAYFIYTLEINIRASVILSYVGFQGYVYQLQNNIDQGWYDWVGAMLLPLLLVVAVLQFISNTMARHLR